MPEITAHAPGTFCWVELMTSDAAAAKTFYGDLFHWNHHDGPIGENTVYTMLMKGDRNVAALYQRNAQQEQLNLPPAWSHYVSVADADATVARIKKHGGQIILEPMDIMDIGRMAVCQDPAGATLCLWQPRKHIGAHLRGEPGSLCWNELMTRDPRAASAFLQAVFGWEPQAVAMEGPSYTRFNLAGQPVAGMIEIMKEWGELSPSWLAYFAVDACDAAVEQARSLGGALTAGPYDIAVGRIAILRDPQGARFAITELKA